MKKIIKYIIIIACIFAMALSTVACGQPHVCQNVCEICGKCTDEHCEYDECADKCQGHAPAHVCESVCSTCGKCTDQTCQDSACADKCQGHAPAHVCESVCPTCNKCTDQTCQDSACANKCQGHNHAPAGENQFDLVFMTFNIRTISSSDTGNKNWENRKSAVASYINNSGADLIVYQEVRKAQYTYLDGNINGKYTTLYFPREGGTNPEGLAISFKTDKFDLVSQEKFWLSDTPYEQSYGWDGEEYYRIGAGAVLKHKETGTDINVFSFHGPLASENARVNAIKLILQKIANSNNPTFLGGDFNAHPSGDCYKTTSEYMQDCRLSAPESDTANTFSQWGNYSDDSSEVEMIIDFCFISKVGMNALSFRVDNESRWGDGNLYSDHYACFSTVRVDVPEKSNQPATDDNGFEGEMDVA